MSRSSTQKTTTKTSVTVREKTLMKWIVDVPPKMMMTPLQMEFKCDGNRVRIPWLRFFISDDQHPFLESVDEEELGANDDLEEKDVDRVDGQTELTEQQRKEVAEEMGLQGLHK